MIISKTNPKSLEILVTHLLQNNVVIVPTDTVYGFSGTIPNTQNKIMEIKGRCESKSFIRLISSPKEIYNYTNQIIPDILMELWPGALTLIVKLKDELATFSGETVAFRCPGDLWLRNVIKKLGKPIFSTSVNKTGEPVMFSVQEMEAVFGEQVACIVDGESQVSKDALPSTIIDLSGEKYKIIRQGSVKIPCETIV